MNTFNFKFKTLLFALTGVLFLSIGDAYSMGSVYSDGRAFLRPGCPSGAGKVYVGKSASETTMATPASSSFKACNSSTTAAMTQQEKGTEKKTWYHFFAEANPGYKFTGWYDPDDKLLTMTDATRNYYRGMIQSGTMALNGDLHAYVDCYAGFVKCIQMSFVRPTNGEFTITNNGATVSDYATFTVDGRVFLTAQPAPGYKLRGWYTTTNGGATKTYVAFGTTYEPLSYTSNVTIGAEFVPDDGKATFWIKGTNQLYDNLTAANTAAASSSSKTIVVVSDGVVGAGTYNINSGVTLLIPFREVYDIMKAPRQIRVTNSTASTMKTTTFRKLSLADGAIINCYGAICVCGTLASVSGNHYSSFPVGTVGLLDMSKGGRINLKSGSNLYCWGYVKGQDMDQGNNTTGCGQISAESGSHVWEIFQVGDWRGGGDCLTIYNNSATWRYFPFQAWTIQNVEVPVTYVSGSKCHCYWSIFGNGEINTINFVAISDKNGGGIFQISPQGSVKKWYDPTTDRICVELGGASVMDAISLNVLGEDFSSEDYNLPLPANVHVILADGSNSAISKPLVAHAGSIIEVKSGGKLTIGGTLYLFDKDDWDMYCMNKYYGVYNSPSVHFDRGTGATNDILEDATIIADGTVTVTGNLYATAHGANIMGNNAGTLTYSKLPGNTTMVQCKERVKNVSVAVRSANLHNENGTYTKGSVATYKNVNGRWFLSSKSTPKSNKTYDFTYIKSGDVYGTGGTNATVSACYSKDQTGTDLRDKWANIKASICDDWWDGIDDGHKYNYYENNAWHQFIKTTMTVGEDEDAMDIYSGTNGKLYAMNEDCDVEEFGDIDGNCQYTIDGVKKVLIGNSFVNVVKNSDDEAYHKADAETTYYICFSGCVWHPATKVTETGKTPAYTVEGTNYIWFNGAWLGVQWDSSVSLYYSLSPTNVKIYYEYVNSAWVLATPVAEVETALGTEQVYSMSTAITKAKEGGTNVTIRLLKSFSTGQIAYSYGNNCSLDLNGFTLTINTSSPIYVNHANAKFIIKDQSASGTGKLMTKYNRTDGMVYGLNAHLGCCILNSGTVHVENTNTADSKGACGATVADGQTLIINGGTLEAVSKFETRGISHGATTHVTINGGTVTATTSATVQCPYGIYSSGGTIDMNGGLVLGERTVETGESNKKYAYGIILANNACRLNMTGGEIKGKAPNRAFGLQVGTSGQTSAVATLTGGTITAETTSHSALAILSYATTNLNGVTLKGSPGSSYGYGVKVNAGTTTCNAGTKIDVKSTTYSHGFCVEGGTLNVNGGTIEVKATSTTNAFGIYAMGAGAANTEGGDFKVTTKTTNAYAAYMKSDATGSCTLGGGKYMVKTSDGSSTSNAFVNNTDAPTGKLALAGGYYNLTPSNTYVQGGKTVKDLDPTAEASLISAGYKKKIVGAEKTVTWKNYDGTVLATTLSEGGKHPQWEGETPTYDFGESTGIFDGWCTAASNGGTHYSGELPAIGGTDPTYFAHYRMIVAEVSINGVTTPYETPEDAWAAAMATGHTQALIRLLANVTNVGQLTFAPADANAIITLDLNGHSWTMDGSSAASQKSPMLLVNKAGSKLIVTDNSTSANGYLLNEWNSTAAVLYCARVQAGELVLERGALKSHHTGDAYRAEAVYVTNASSTDKGKFTMLGGTVEAWGANSPRGINLQATSAGVEITSGTVKATGSGTAPYALLAYGQASVSGDAVIEAVSTNGVNGCYAVTAHNLGNIRISGSPKIKATVDGYAARGLSAVSDGTIEVESLDSVIVTAPNNRQAFAVYAESTGSIIVHDGVFKTHSKTGQSTGVHANGNSTITVHGGIWKMTSEANNNRVIIAQGNSTVNVTGGNFTVDQTATSEVEAIRCYVGTTLNISGGTFTVKENGAIARNAIIFYGGTMNISGSAMFKSKWGIIADNTSGLTANTACSITIDGGTFDLSGFCFKVKPTTKDGFTMTPTVTVNGGKFKTGGNTMDYANTPVERLIINGGYYNTDSDGRLSVYNATTNPTGYVRSPSTVETLTSGPEYEEGYRKYVGTKYQVVWKFAGATVKEDYYRRGETPSFGSGSPVPEDGNTYEFTGWSPTPEPITANTTYNAVYTKYEAEVIEGEEFDGNGDLRPGIRYANLIDAFNYARNLPIATVRILSNVDNLGYVLNLNPDSVDGGQATTIDLNNHTITYTGTSDRIVTVGKAGKKLIITDNSTAKGGKMIINQSRSSNLYGAIVQYGEMELAGGELVVTNTYSGKGVRGVAVGYTDSSPVFTMTGGKVSATATTDARGVVSNGGTPTMHFEGGKVIARSYSAVSGSDTTWTATAYGVLLQVGSAEISGTAEITAAASQDAYSVYIYNAGPSLNITGGTVVATTYTSHYAFALCIKGGTENTISGGTFKAFCKSGQNAHALHAVGSSKVDITNGTFYSCTNNGQSHCVYLQKSTVNIAGGTFTGTSETASAGNVEAVRVNNDGILTIDDGTFKSDSTANKAATISGIALRNFGGTVTVNGGTFISTNRAVGVADATIGVSGMNVSTIINGGTFIATGAQVMYATTHDGTTSVALTVNGGYFFTSANDYIVTKGGSANIVLNGGKYNERTGTVHRANLTTFKGSTTKIDDISETVDGKTYVYQLSTKFHVTWVGGDSYSKEEDIYSGIVPSNNALVGGSFTRNDSTFYFTGWSPTPSAVVGNVTYQAVGDYYEAKVKIGSSEWIYYDNIAAAWDTINVTEANATSTITLLNNVTLTERLMYMPEMANARTTLDLNNFTLAENTTDMVIAVSKAGAKLTITDNSTAKGGCIYKKKSSDINIFAVRVSHGEVDLAGGKLYVENTYDNDDWHPVYALNSIMGDDAIITVSGGTVEAVSLHGAYGICGYGPVNVTGGTIKAKVTKYNNARAIAQIAGIATITGGYFEAKTTGDASISIAVSATGTIGSKKTNVYHGTINITGGTFLAESEHSAAQGVQATGVIREFETEYVTTGGVLNISGGQFTVKCGAATATQVVGAIANAARKLDEASPHHILAEGKGEVNISGGTFLVDTRNNGEWVENGGNVDMIRNWGTVNVTGGTFTIYQNQSAAAVSSYRNKITISGTPEFNVHCKTGARAVVAGDWNHQDYCDADPTKNIAEVEVNGGTFNVTSSAEEATGARSMGRLAGEAAVYQYAMSSKVTINGGEFICTSPSNVRMFQKSAPQVGANGTAYRQIYVTGGKFLSQRGTIAADGSVATVTGKGSNIYTGSNDVKLDLLSGGYYNTSDRLENDRADTCVVEDVTSAEPEYAQGYRYKITNHRRVKVESGGVERCFANLTQALDYSKDKTDPLITLLDNTDLVATYRVQPTVSNWHGTIDLNNFAVTSYTNASNPDRFLIMDKSDATLTITDNSTAKGGVWNLTKAYADATLIGMVVSNGILELAGGKLYAENTSASKAVQAVSCWGLTATFRMTGGMIEAANPTGGNAECIIVRGAVNVSDGTLKASTTSGYSRGLTMYTDATTLTLSGGKINAEQAIANPANGTKTITGGYYSSRNTNNSGVYLDNLLSSDYNVRETTAADKAAVGSEYNYKVVPVYQIRFLNYDNSVLQTSMMMAGETPTYSGTPTKPADASYVYTFTGWSPAIAAVTGAQDYTAQYSQAQSVASVTINGTTTYYSTMADAFAAANASTTYEPTIKVLRTVTGITGVLVYSNADQNGILDLNNCTLSSSTLEFLLVVNSSTSKTLTITDSSSAKNGEIHIEANRDWVNVVGVWKGKLILNNGKIYGQNTSTTTVEVEGISR